MTTLLTIYAVGAVAVALLAISLHLLRHRLRLHQVAPTWQVGLNVLTWPLWVGGFLLGLLVVEPLRCSISSGVAFTDDKRRDYNNRRNR